MRWQIEYTTADKLSRELDFYGDEKDVGDKVCEIIKKFKALQIIVTRTE